MCSRCGVNVYVTSEWSEVTFCSGLGRTWELQRGKHSFQTEMKNVLKRKESVSSNDFVRSSRILYKGSRLRGRTSWHCDPNSRLTKDSTIVKADSAHNKTTQTASTMTRNTTDNKRKAICNGSWEMASSNERRTWNVLSGDVSGFLVQVRSPLSD